MNAIKFSIILLFLKLNLFAQTPIVSNDSLTQLLKGTWWVVNSWPAVKDTLIFAKKPHTTNFYGDRIEINENGEIIDTYSALYENDSIFHMTIGSWKLDKSGLIFTTSVPIFLDRKKNKILELNAEKLVLLRLE